MTAISAAPVIRAASVPSSPLSSGHSPHVVIVARAGRRRAVEHFIRSASTRLGLRGTRRVEAERMKCFYGSATTSPRDNHDMIELSPIAGSEEGTEAARITGRS